MSVAPGLVPPSGADLGGNRDHHGGGDRHRGSERDCGSLAGRC